VAPTDSLKKAMSRMTQSGYDELMVVAADDPGRLLGSLSRRELIAAYHRKMLASDPDAAPVRALDAAVETPAAEEDLVAALLRGGVVAPARGGTRDDVLRALVAGAAFPEDVDRDALAEALIAREQLGSTGVGHGIAIPHPHVADVAGFSEPTIVLGLTARPIDWGSLDGQPVTTVALLIVPPGHSRLEVLGRLARCLSDAGFQEALASRAPTPRIVAHLQVLQGQFR
jgi:PTS system nitrogen regulatory IIA component